VRFIDPLAGRTKEGTPARILEAVWIEAWERWASVNTDGTSASLWRDGVFRKMFIPETEVAVQPALFPAESSGEGSP
jgi:hypothetical protein